MYIVRMKLFGSIYLLFAPKDLNNEMRIRYTSKMQPKAGQGFDCRDLKKVSEVDQGDVLRRIHNNMIKLDTLHRIQDTKQAVHIRRQYAEQAIKCYAEPVGPFDTAVAFWLEQESGF